MLPSSFLCPRCKCGACYALHRKGFDWLIYVFRLRPVRCLTCKKRFYARYSLDEGQAHADDHNGVAGGESHSHRGQSLPN